MDQLRRGDFGYSQISDNFAISGLSDDEVASGTGTGTGSARRCSRSPSCRLPATA